MTLSRRVRLLALIQGVDLGSGLDDISEGQRDHLLLELGREPRQDVPMSTFDPLSDPLDDPFPEELR